MTKTLDVTKGFDLQDEEEMKCLETELLKIINSKLSDINSTLVDVALNLIEVGKLGSEGEERIYKIFIREAYTIKLLLTLQDILGNRRFKDTSFTF